MPSIQRPVTTSANIAAAMLTGEEWVIDAAGCDPEKLASLDLIQSICDRVVRDLGLNVVGSLEHKFPSPGGVTVLYLLSESHLAGHTYPEHGIATFNLYCCRDRESWKWEQELQFSLSANSVSVRRLERGQR
jgi:S-adenosylmethionine decarboxylase